MKVVIAGSRSITSYGLVKYVIILSNFDITEIVSGRARGVDRLGERWATENSIPIKYFPADWEQYGKAAGFVRNSEMVEYADAVIAIWDGKSKGTEHTINLCRKSNKKLYVYRLLEKQNE